MRIAVSGTHFIGKTTLIEDFLKKHPDYRCEKEAYCKLQDEKEMELSLEPSLAHRLSTLKDMDRILVFVNGEIVEDGSLESLLQNKETHFYKLWQMQAEGFIPTIGESLK